jgi:hypothetical protein
VHSITGAAGAHSDDLDARIRRYLISMAIRTVCVILALVVGWPWRWIFIVGAVGLPYVAVVMANVSGGRGRTAVPTVDARPMTGLGGGQATSSTMTGEPVAAQTFRETRGGPGGSVIAVPDDDLPLGAEKPWSVTDLTQATRIDLTPADGPRPADADGADPTGRSTAQSGQTGPSRTGQVVPGEIVGPESSSERLNHGSGERTA